VTVARYVALFALIQSVSFALMLVGFPICAALSALDSVTYKTSPVTGKRIAVWKPKIFWLWSNDEDGVDPAGYSTRLEMFVWTAWRNSVNNLRFVRGISKVGRPLFYRTWTVRGQQYYVKAGWMSDGYPCCSMDKGRGY
jgi:hypothetical protein